MQAEITLLSHRSQVQAVAAPGVLVGQGLDLSQAPAALEEQVAYQAHLLITLVVVAEVVPIKDQQEALPVTVEALAVLLAQVLEVMVLRTPVAVVVALAITLV